MKILKSDLAKQQNFSDPSFTVKNWLRRVTTIDYVGLWEQLNVDINLVEFDQLKLSMIIIHLNVSH